MTRRENYFAIMNRMGYEKAEPHIKLCPKLIEDFQDILNGEDYRDYFDLPSREIGDPILPDRRKDYMKFYPDYTDETKVDLWGVMKIPGSAESFHMKRIIHPFEGVDDEELINSYWLPDFEAGDDSHLKGEVEALKARDLIAMGQMGQTIWERAWMIRGMEDLFVEMMTNDPIAENLFDKITQSSISRARVFAKAGVDVLCVGDDIGMQDSIMMSVELYREWLKPRMKKVIDAAKAIKPDIKIMYHSCGYVEPFIPDLIEIGVDILNPVQPECMDFKKIHDMYGDKLCFNGAVGTQSTMPLGSVEDVKEVTKRNLKIAGEKGGLFCCPTHLLEPDVPRENILAYLEAIKEYNEEMKKN